MNAFSVSRTAIGAAAFALAAAVGSGAADAQSVDFDCSDLTGASVVHFQGPYTQQLAMGAEAAVDECGGTYRSGGPAAFDASAQVAAFQDMVLAGADAIVVVAFPSEFWIRPIDEAVEKGVVVSTFDVEAPASLMSLHTAPKQSDQGVVMADAIVDAIGADASGTIVTGICLPGLALIEARVTGFKNRIAERLPDVEVLGAFDVKFDQTQNFSAWRSVYDANPDALAYVGFCENDLPSLVRLKESTGGDFEIASIGINPDGLDGIKRGIALAAVGQRPFMQGYVAMRAMLQSLAEGNDVPRGWIDVRPELVASDNVEAVTAREESVSDGYGPTREFYSEQIDEIFSDLDGSVQSFADLLSQ
ncbi:MULTISPECIES: substrate-binding domain-containing protein [unclassified Roseitalea]|uniref:sugar ABC transporter substrate-binding protein n=1 Tax=unclassified Roseitalea TaxID=2639107 RepID=UPI00273E76FC|nr:MULTISPECIES: substrate-binding domain-containing protein [unclassified Roseitalea]